jgi:uncharacterized protein YbaP (TraB family)
MKIQTKDRSMKKGTVSLVLVILLFVGINAAQADAPVWKVVKGKNQLFIGGTLHLLSKSDYPLPEAFESAYRQSAMVVFEADMEKMQSPEFQQLLQSKVVYTDGRTLKTVLKEATYQALEQHMSSRGLPIASFDRLKPGMLAITLTLVELQRLGLVGTGVDEFFNLRARNDHKTIGQLETAEKQLAFLSTMGDGREDDLITHTLRDIQKLPQLMTSLKAAWRQGDRGKIKELAITPIKKDFPKVYQQLLVQRNRDWIPEIEKMMGTKEVEFILVGAAHLVGEEGILAQLAARGYAIQSP